MTVPPQEAKMTQLAVSLLEQDITATIQVQNIKHVIGLVINGAQDRR